MRKGKRTEQNGIDHREDGEVRPETDRDRGEGGDREHRIFDQLPKSKPEITHNEGRQSDRRGTASRSEARRCGDHREDCRYCKVNGRIERVHFEQDVLQGRGGENAKKQCGPTRSKNESDHQLPGALGHDHAKNPRGVGS